MRDNNNPKDRHVTPETGTADTPRLMFAWRFDRAYLIFGLSYAVLGMSVGIAMAASHNHGQMVTHAHILLVGFVVSFIYAIIKEITKSRGSLNSLFIYFNYS